MPTVRVEVRRLLDTRLKTLSGLPPVKWENSSFAPPSSGPWLRPTLTFSSAEALTVCADGDGQEAATRGLYLVDVFAPPDDGPYVPDDLAGRVCALFSPRAGRLVGSGVSVLLGVPYAGAGMGAPPEEQTPAYMVPVTIPFTAFHPG